MRAVVQRVTDCSVQVDGKTISSISRGLLVYLGIEKGDLPTDVLYLAEKITGLRIFEDNNGKMNLSVLDTDGEMLIISQFTLCADTRKGRRPSYNNAALPSFAEVYYNDFIKAVKKYSLNVEQGCFGAHMDVKYINKGPVTILLDSKKLF